MKLMPNLQTEEGDTEKDKNKESLRQMESSEELQHRNMPEEDSNEGQSTCKDESQKSPEERPQSNVDGSKKDEDLEKKGDCDNRAPPQSEKGKTHPFVETHSEGGTKTKNQKRLATLFTIEKGDMKEDDRTRGALYLGKKYETCASTVQGEGCLFFKWECEDRPVMQTDMTAGANCSCGVEPLTISVPQLQKDKSAKRFQVCQAQDKKCEFFLWVDEPKRDGRHCKNQETNGQTIEAEQKTFFKGSSEKGTCKKHFMFKQQVENTTEREEWWKENYNPSTVSNVKVKQDEILRRRLITTLSMVFTRIPRLLSKLTPDSQLILMR